MRRAADYFLHDPGLIVCLEFFESVVVSGAIDKLNVDWHISFADKQVIIDCPADSAVTVNKRVGVLPKARCSRAILRTICSWLEALYSASIFS